MKNKKQTIFITGSARSGKSNFALELASSLGRDIIFIATCGIRNDPEMRARIEKHKSARPMHWKTVEEEVDLINAIKTADNTTDAIIVDCLTLWASNLLELSKTEDEIIQIAEDTIRAANKINSSVIFISNEVGWGIVPENKMARDFRDIIGRTNQVFAKFASVAYLVTSGIPLKLK